MRVICDVRGLDSWLREHQTGTIGRQARTASGRMTDSLDVDAAALFRAHQELKNFRFGQFRRYFKRFVSSRKFGHRRNWEYVMTKLSGMDGGGSRNVAKI